MGIHLGPLVAFLIAAVLLLLVFFVFSRVRLTYRKFGRLTHGVAVLQTGFFFVYAFSSYIFLDSRLTAVSAAGMLLGLAIVLMTLGLAVVLLSMPFLGRKSFGMEVGSLNTSGIYRFSRNPQLLGSFLFVVGYALLWPSASGLIWAALWVPISILMVKGEEEHLAVVFGQAYEAYCKRTSRWVGIPR